MADTVSLTSGAVPVRRRFTRSDVEAMMRAGVIVEGGPEELLDGELWVMPAEGEAHIDLKTWLNRRLAKWAPDDVGVACDTTLRLSETHTPSPDIYLFPTVMKASAVRGGDVLLLIEIADSSLQQDLALNGPKYREYGVREYWVIDVGARVTHVHCLDGAWPGPPVTFDVELRPGLLPQLALRLAEAD
jgi:Uma2 family endonuclease